MPGQYSFDDKDDIYDVLNPVSYLSHFPLDRQPESGSNRSSTSSCPRMTPNSARPWRMEPFFVISWMPSSPTPFPRYSSSLHEFDYLSVDPIRRRFLPSWECRCIHSRWALSRCSWGRSLSRQRPLRTQELQAGLPEHPGLGQSEYSCVLLLWSLHRFWSSFHHLHLLREPQELHRHTDQRSKVCEVRQDRDVHWAFECFGWVVSQAVFHLPQLQHSSLFWRLCWPWSPALLPQLL